MKKKITIRALEQRVGRCLRKRNESLHKSRNPFDQIGPYYVVDSRINGIVNPKIDKDGLVEMGKDFGVLKPWEEVETEND